MKLPRTAAGFLLLSFTLGLASCTSGPGCEEVAKHIIEISSDDKKQGVTAEILEERCEEEKPSKKERSCIRDAKTFADASACKP